MKNNLNTFENLDAWKEAHKLVLRIYKETKVFPSEERYRLIDQLCRASSSVAANIVEGNARLSKKEHLHYLNMAKGSLEETKYHLLLAKDLGYLKDEIYEEIIIQAQGTGRLITGLMKYFTNSLNH